MQSYGSKQETPRMGTATLTIRNIPEDVMASLRRRAAANRRSMQGEILQILETATREPVVHLGPSEALRRIRRLGLTTPAEATDMIRADRDGR